MALFVNFRIIFLTVQLEYIWEIRLQKLLQRRGKKLVVLQVLMIVMMNLASSTIWEMWKTCRKPGKFTTDPQLLNCLVRSNNFKVCHTILKLNVWDRVTKFCFFIPLNCFNTFSWNYLHFQMPHQPKLSAILVIGPYTDQTWEDMP